MRFSEMSNEEVLASLKTLVAEGNRIVAKVIAYLVEVEARRIHLELACSSMFEFCLKKLGFSESEAFRRIAAARVVRRFPTVLDAIASGRVHLSSVVALRDHFTAENVEDLLDQAAGKSKRDVEHLIARLAPKADVPSRIRKVPERIAAATRSSTTEPPRSGSGSTVPPQTILSPDAAKPTARPLVQRLSESRYRVQLTASARLRDKLEYARSLMSHRNPSGDLAAVVEEALEVLIEKLEKAKLGRTERPRAATPPKDPGDVSRAVRREVVERDDFRCSFVGQNGERCSSRERLELDHRIPRALGGSGDPSNIRLLCRAHNIYAAGQVFGRAHHRETDRLAPGEVWNRCKLSGSAGPGARRASGHGLP
jgi:5-methylcytosine-specific restriction endonuclease McrA